MQPGALSRTESGTLQSLSPCETLRSRLSRQARLDAPPHFVQNLRPRCIASFFPLSPCPLMRDFVFHVPLPFRRQRGTSIVIGTCDSTGDIRRLTHLAVDTKKRRSSNENRRWFRPRPPPLRTWVGDRGLGAGQNATAAEPGAIPPSREMTAQSEMGVRRRRISPEGSTWGQGGREMVWRPIPSRLHPPRDSRGMWGIYITCRATAQDAIVLALQAAGPGSAASRPRRGSQWTAGPWGQALIICFRLLRYGEGRGAGSAEDGEPTQSLETGTEG